MLDLFDSSGSRGDADTLRTRLSEDGYLFFRGLLPAAAVHEACAAVLAALTEGGWLEPSGALATDRRALNARDALQDPGFRAALTSSAFNRIPYLPPLRGLVRALLGPEAFSYPMKVLRAVYPEVPPDIASGRLVHQDFAVSAVPDLLTTWVPLMDIPAELGGLAVLPGSQLRPPQRARVLGADEPGWLTIDYRAGDVVLFHCLTAHAALPNRSDRLRISQDSRWQAVEEIAPAEMVSPAGYVERPGLPPPELFAPRFRGEPWWEPVPDGATIVRRSQRGVVPARSRYFAVDPAWAGWRAESVSGPRRGRAG